MPWNAPPAEQARLGTDYAFRGSVTKWKTTPQRTVQARLSASLRGLSLALIIAASTVHLISAPQPETLPLDAANRLFEERKYSQAEKAFRDLLATTIDNPTRGKATFNLGLTLQRLGRFKEAIAVFEGLIRQQVSDTEPGGHLMEPYRNYRPRAQWEIGNCFRAMNDYGQALAAYRATREKYPFQS